MKINGELIKGKNLVTVFIPRLNGGYEFTCQPVDRDLFDKYCPLPSPPMLTRPGKAPQPDFKDKKYKKALEENNELWFAFMIVYSLLATEGFEWSEIDLEDPQSWLKYQDEFKAADLSNMEVNRIGQAVLQANSLDDAHIKAAHQSFLVMKKLQEVAESFQQDAQENTESGEPVKD